jgi:hypothetical protein
MVAVRLHPRPRLGGVDQRPAVRREHRQAVGRGVRRRQVARRMRPVERHQVEVEVGRPRLRRPRQARRIHHPLLVRREGILLRAAVGLRRRVGLHPAHEVHHRRLGLVEREGQEVRAGAVFPHVPMPHEPRPLAVEARLHPALRRPLQAVVGAGQRRAVRKHVGARHRQLAVARHREARQIDRRVRQLLELRHPRDLPRHRRQPPDLAAPRPAGEEVQRPAVRRPARIVVARVVGGQRLLAAAVDVDQPQVVAAAVRRQVVAPHHEHHPIPPWRSLRLRHPQHRLQIRGIERMPRREPRLPRRQRPGRHRRRRQNHCRHPPPPTEAAAARHAHP